MNGGKKLFFTERVLKLKEWVLEDEEGKRCM